MEDNTKVMLDLVIMANVVDVARRVAIEALESSGVIESDGPSAVGSVGLTAIAFDALSVMDKGGNHAE